MAEKTTEWPSFRINPATKKRLVEVLDRAKNGSPLMRIIDDMLGQAMDQIDAENPKCLLPIVASLRAQLGLKSVADAGADLDSRLAAIEAKLAAMHLRENAPQETTYLKAAEESPTPKPRRPKP